MIERITDIHNLNSKRVRKLNGETRAVEATPALIGAAAADHEHDENEINDLLPVMDNIRNAVQTAHASARAMSVLQEGVNVVPATTDGIADVEIEGRTLVSMANSNLVAGKKYVLADPKTKVVVDKQTVSGVGKFVKGTTTSTTADFKNKTTGNTTVNPHVGKYEISDHLLLPASFYKENGEGTYIFFSALDGNVQAFPSSVNGSMPVQLFSFNMIQQIERELGLIPGDGIEEKVVWIRNNVQSVVANWYGYGSGPSGNKASFTQLTSGSNWSTFPSYHTQSTVNKCSKVETNPASVTDSNGFFHTIAYGEPSDGVTPSTLNTDYINLEITLKTTAQLNTRPTIIRSENFEGKVAGSATENPHVAKYAANPVLLKPGQGVEFDTANYTKMMVLDGGTQSVSYHGGGNSVIGQKVFSYDLIELVERKIGKIPAAGVSEKTSWLINNIRKISCSWRGYGKNQAGNKATLAVWNKESLFWGGHVRHENSYVSPLKLSNIYPSALVTESGEVHFTVYAEPSNGTESSSIYTDYIEVEIELKPTADFHAPRVPLYEVGDASYNKILGEWPAAEVTKRYPAVEGMQHLENVVITSPGKNLAPVESDDAFNTLLSTNAFKNKWVSGKLEVTSGSTHTRGNGFRIKTIPGQVYYLSFKSEYPSDGAVPRILIEGVDLAIYSSKTFVANSDFTDIKFLRNGLNNPSDPAKFWNIMINVGATQNGPFVLPNPSSLYLGETLGQIGNKKDLLVKEDDGWKVRRKVSQEIKMDGTLDWFYASTSLQPSDTSLRKVAVYIVKNYHLLTQIIKYDGKEVVRKIHSDHFKDNHFPYGGGQEGLGLHISIEDSGWVTTPDSSDIKRYFNGWKYTDGTTWMSVTGNGETATAQNALETQPSDYTPYKLIYELPTPVIESVEFEGDIKVGGLTQVELSGGADQELKVNPVDVKIFYPQDFTTSFRDMISQAEDLATRASVNRNALLDAYIELQALKGGG